LKECKERDGNSAMQREKESKTKKRKSREKQQVAVLLHLSGSFLVIIQKMNALHSISQAAHTSLSMHCFHLFCR
jgi:hypothetical protein